MDNTILHGRLIDACAKQYGFEKQLLDIRSGESDGTSITKNIARQLKGLDLSQIFAVVDSIALVDDVKDVVTKLKAGWYVVGVISVNYDVVTNRLKTKIGAVFSLANELECSMNVPTGEVKLPSFFFHTPESLCKHTICKPK